MKIIATVTEVSDTGDTIAVRMQGGAVTMPEWMRCRLQTVAIPHTERNRRAFYVGREVTIEVKPR